MGNTPMGGKSEHERTRWWVTPTRPNTPARVRLGARDSATENKPPMARLAGHR